MAASAGSTVASLVAWGLLNPDAMLVGLFLVVSLVGLTVDASASEYDPPGLYDVDYFKLTNGLNVIIKQRNQAHSASVRLVVNVGNRNFPCPERETPHFLEHLLFMGTSKHSEAELKRLIEDHGGAWNGYTSPTETGYQIDIYDKHLPLAIDTLHEMITDTIITPKTIESARAVIHRERSGKLSRLVEWLYENGILKPASAKAVELLVPGTGVICPGVISPDEIKETDVREAYKAYYVPSNMTLVVVGSFDRDSLVSQIKSTFGNLTPRASNGSKVVTPPYPDGPKTVSGTLSPLVGSDGAIGFLYRTDGSDSPDYYALWVTWKHLERQLYEKIRVDKALSYSPASAYAVTEDYGAFAIAADVSLDKMETAKTLLEQEIENVRQGRIRSVEIEDAKQRILLGRAQGFESNSGIAAYYVTSRFQLEKTGKLVSHEDSISKVTPEDVQRVANKYLRADRQIIFWSTPTLTWTQFVVGLGIFVVAIPSTGFYLLRRFIKRRRSVKGIKIT
jgi:predicted Zn-dependent peptidase